MPRGAELRRLLAPVTPKVFLSRYWGQRALYIPGTPQKFGALFGRKAFWRALEVIDALGPHSRALIRAHYERDVLPRGAPDAYANVSAPEARKAFKAGATLCVNAISAGDARVTAFARAVKAQLHYPGEVRFNAYLSPPGRGLPMHFDARVACAIQLEGKKTWWFSARPAVHWPRSNADPGEGGSADYVDPRAGREPWERADPNALRGLARVTLRPGDVLVLPAGTWHCAQADRSASLALNLAFDPLTPLDFLAAALGPRLREDPRWRALPPALMGGDALPPDPTRRFLRERIAELRRALERLDDDHLALASAWSHVFS